MGSRCRGGHLRAPPDCQTQQALRVDDAPRLGADFVKRHFKLQAKILKQLANAELCASPPLLAPLGG